MKNIESYPDYICLIGKITYGFSRTDLLLSHIAKEIGVVKDYMEFFSGYSMQKKIKRLKDNSACIPATNLRSRFIQQIETFESLKDKRNSIIHSIVMENPDSEAYLFYSAEGIKGKGFRAKAIVYSIEDLKTLEKEFSKNHNHFFIIWKELRNYANNKNIRNV